MHSVNCRPFVFRETVSGVIILAPHSLEPRTSPVAQWCDTGATLTMGGSGAVALKAASLLSTVAVVDKPHSTLQLK